MIEQTRIRSDNRNRKEASAVKMGTSHKKIRDVKQVKHHGSLISSVKVYRSVSNRINHRINQNQPPKSSKLILLRSTPRLSSIFRTDFVIMGGPHI